jgi:hypothetical protein
MPKLTICGGGNAAHVLIALAGHSGWQVDVLATLADEATRLQTGMARGGITARFQDRAVAGQARCISADPAEVIPGSELVLLALPAFAHGLTLRAIAAHLDPGARIGALPARGGFDYEARAILATRPSGGSRANGAAGEPSPAALPYILFGLQTLPWACRIITYGQEVAVLGSKAVIDLAAIPAGAAPDLARQLEPLLAATLKPVTSFLALNLANTGQLIHPGIMYGLCQGREELTFRPEEVPLFYQGVDQPTADLLQIMSDEIQFLGRTLAGRLPEFDPRAVIPLYEWLLRAYPADIVDDHTLLAALATNRAYAGLRLPTRPATQESRAIDFTARYLAEDVPYGLVVMRGIAELAGVPTPTLDKVICWAQARLGRRYLVDGALAGPDMAETRAPQVYGLATLAQLAA